MNDSLTSTSKITVSVLDDGMLETHEKILKSFNDALKAIWDEDIQFVPAMYHTRITSLVKQGHLDAFNKIDIIESLEEDFSIEIPDDAFDNAIVVADFVLFIASLTGNLTPATAAVTPAPTVDTSHNNDCGILVIPSLEEHGRMIISQPVSIEEAKTLVAEFTARVIATKKVKDAQPIHGYNSDDEVEDIEFYHNLLRFDQIADDADFEALDHELHELAISKIPKTRGFRPIFISPTVVGIGTTVIYNKNWATVNFSDDTVAPQLLKLAEDFK